MKNNYKIITVTSGDMYVVKVVEETETVLKVENPLKVEYKYNTEQMPVFRYLAWQILSDEDPIVDIAKSHITMMGLPHKELQDVYERISVQFIPLEDDDPDDDIDVETKGDQVILSNQKVIA